MRVNLLPLILLCFSCVQITSAKLAPTCFKVAAALVSRPGDLFELFQQEICDKGCQPTVPHWDLWVRHNTFIPAVRNLMKRLNAPDQEETLLKLGDDAADIIKRQCGPTLQGRHICEDPETLSGFGNCLKKNFFKASIKNLPVLLPMASEELCREQYQYLQGNQLWDDIIPQNMRDYAETCHTLGDRAGHDEL